MSPSSRQENCHCTRGHILSDLDTPQEVHFAGGFTFTEVPPTPQKQAENPAIGDDFKRRYMAKRKLDFSHEENTEQEILLEHESTDEDTPKAPMSLTDCINALESPDESDH